MNRRTCLTVLAALAASPARAIGLPGTDPLAAAWAAWKEAHIDPSGRVIDRLQGGASHSEGQSWGLTLAARMGDIDAFEAMLAWTEANLAVREDGLLAWRWLPDAAIPVADLNNASDGDLFFAWALTDAAARFERGAYHTRAAAIVAALDAACVVPFPGQEGAYLLSPGAHGFETEAGHVVNPSYYMLRAMTELASLHGAPRLGTAAQNGDVLLADLARRGPMPDWVEVTPEGPRPAEAFTDNRGYEAIRVPLWLVWSGHATHPAVKAAAQRAAQMPAPAGQSATIRAAADGAVLETSPAPGYAAIDALVDCAASRDVGGALPPFDRDQPYYPATLQMLAFLAQIDAAPECFPL